MVTYVAVCRVAANRVEAAFWDVARKGAMEGQECFGKAGVRRELGELPAHKDKDKDRIWCPKYAGLARAGSKISTGLVMERSTGDEDDEKGGKTLYGIARHPGRD
ncbi:hypothetical protein QBC47DRAFT_360493 [Echria macrotheca]|uniref:Uncharacterized protein n=1 Tax=Echria macrotheca TaxID=438768 RepID=A0AAJ0BEE1_9PEZI|nr:hypothetical protein QBC47DRAFT_360493 [Echria macrotheca]